MWFFKIEVGSIDEINLKRNRKNEISLKQTTFYEDLKKKKSKQFYKFMHFITVNAYFFIPIKNRIDDLHSMTNHTTLRLRKINKNEQPK